MSHEIVTSEFKTSVVNNIIEKVAKEEIFYYAFASDHYEESTTVTETSGSQKEINSDINQNIIFGKRLSASVTSPTTGNLLPMIRRYNWTANTVYSMYDDINGDLFNEQFYVNVDEGSYIHVWKCLDNANGSASNSQPYIGDANTNSALFQANDSYYETSDGYQWKYMYSVDSTTFSKFATNRWIPVVANSSVSNTALDGSIDVIKVDSFGDRYNHYLTGSFPSENIFPSGLSSSGQLYLPSGANTGSNFYANCVIYLDSGPGMGEYRRIVSSGVDATAVWITLSAFDVRTLAKFSVDPNANTTFKIYPEVKVYGDGNETSNAYAYAAINSSSNSVHKVIVLDQGRNYRYATAEVLKNNGYDGTEAEVRPIIGPKGGHGYDAAAELGCHALGIYSIFANTENGNISVENDFNQFGIIEGIRFAEVEVTHVKSSNNSQAGSDGEFVTGEEFYQISKLRLSGNVSITTSNTTIVSDTSTVNYPGFISSGDTIFLKDLSDSANPQYFVANVVSMANTTSMVLDTAPPWTSSTAEIFLAKITGRGIIKSVLTNYFIADEVANKLQVDGEIIGTTSFASAIISGMDINNKYSNNATFSTFENLSFFLGTSIAAIQEDEIITQGTATARVHSITESGGLYQLNVTNVNGTFDPSDNTVVGSTSGASFEYTSFNRGDLDPKYGKVIYLQNHEKISRANNHSEQLRVILEF